MYQKPSPRNSANRPWTRPPALLASLLLFSAVMPIFCLNSLLYQHCLPAPGRPLAKNHPHGEATADTLLIRNSAGALYAICPRVMQSAKTLIGMRRRRAPHRHLGPHVPRQTISPSGSDNGIPSSNIHARTPSPHACVQRIPACARRAGHAQAKQRMEKCGVNGRTAGKPHCTQAGEAVGNAGWKAEEQRSAAMDTTTRKTHAIRPLACARRTCGSARHAHAGSVLNQCAPQGQPACGARMHCNHVSSLTFSIGRRSSIGSSWAGSPRSPGGAA